MKVALSLLLVLLVPSGAFALTSQVDRIDVTEHGIYTATTTSTVARAGTIAGVTAQLSDIRHVNTTRTIPAQRGVKFGFRYAVAGQPAGAIVPLHFVTIFPSPGLTNPETGRLQRQDDYDTNKIIGASGFKSYGFDRDWELSPGVWTFQIWYQGRKLAEQSFTVVKQ